MFTDMEGPLVWTIAACHDKCHLQTQVLRLAKLFTCALAAGQLGSPGHIHAKQEVLANSGGSMTGKLSILKATARPLSSGRLGSAVPEHDV